MEAPPAVCWRISGRCRRRNSTTRTPCCSTCGNQSSGALPRRPASPCSRIARASCSAAVCSALFVQHPPHAGGRRQARLQPREMIHRVHLRTRDCESGSSSATGGILGKNSCNRSNACRSWISDALRRRRSAERAPQRAERLRRGLAQRAARRFQRDRRACSTVSSKCRVKAGPRSGSNRSMARANRCTNGRKDRHAQGDEHRVERRQAHRARIQPRVFLRQPDPPQNTGSNTTAISRSPD
jgi:hypothetical protein